MSVPTNPKENLYMIKTNHVFRPRPTLACCQKNPMHNCEIFIKDLKNVWDH